MDGNTATGGERILRRIIALLVSFAVLAERTADRSAPVRWFVLLILRHAEMVAENYVFEATGMPPSELEEIAPVGNDPDDALSLAARFYTLAAALCALLPLDVLFGGRNRRRGPASGRLAPGSGCPAGGWTRKPNDTS